MLTSLVAVKATQLETYATSWLPLQIGSNPITRSMQSLATTLTMTLAYANMVTPSFWEMTRLSATRMDPLGLEC